MSETTSGEVWSTAEVADHIGVSARSVRGMMTRLRSKGIDLQTPKDTWPDQRSPRYDADAVRAYAASRPGRGRWGRRAS